MLPRIALADPHCRAGTVKAQSCRIECVSDPVSRAIDLLRYMLLRMAEQLTWHFQDSYLRGVDLVLEPDLPGFNEALADSVIAVPGEGGTASRPIGSTSSSSVWRTGPTIPVSSSKWPGAMRPNL